MTVESLLRQAEALTPDERRELAARLLEADDMSNDPPPPDAMKAELDRRVAEFIADPSIGVPWEVVKGRALKRVLGPSEPRA